MFLPDERIDLTAALMAYTAGSAYANHLDDTGSVRAGALADLVVLDRDPYAGPPEEIASAKVALTYVGGRARPHRVGSLTPLAAVRCGPAPGRQTVPVGLTRDRTPRRGSRPASRTGHLAAAGAGHGAGRDEQQGGEPHSVAGGDLGAYVALPRADLFLGGLDLAAVLGDHDEFLARVVGAGHAEGGQPVPADEVHGALDGLLDVLGVVVASVHDDHVLEAAGDQQPSVEQSAVVARAQPTPGSRRVRSARFQ